MVAVVDGQDVKTNHGWLSNGSQDDCQRDCQKVVKMAVIDNCH
jgi:hypothetical protein